MILLDFYARQGFKAISGHEVAVMSQLDQSALTASIQAALDRGVKVTVRDTVNGGMVVEWDNRR